MAAVIEDGAIDDDVPEPLATVAVWLSEGRIVSHDEARRVALCIWHIREREMPPFAGRNFIDVSENLNYFFTHQPA